MSFKTIPDLTKRQLRNFWEKVDRSSDCWLWTGCKTPKRYGVVSLNNAKYYAHRVLFHISGGKYEEGKEVCHSCNNPSCVNPEHLRMDTRKGNSADRAAAGTLLRGSENYASVLDEEKVRCSRKMYQDGHTQKDIAKKYGVNHSTIGYVVRNKTWKHI